MLEIVFKIFSIEVEDAPQIAASGNDIYIES